MNTMAIFWFSGTGNSKYIATLLQESSEKENYSTDLFAIDDLLKLNQLPDIKKYNTVAFIHPVHCFETPPIIYDFVKFCLQSKILMPLS